VSYPALVEKLSNLTNEVNAELKRTGDRNVAALAVALGAVTGAALAGDVELLMEAGGDMAKMGLERLLPPKLELGRLPCPCPPA
jgi:hypothetical protein